MHTDIKETLGIMIRNRFVITASIFFVWICFIDDNSLVQQYDYTHQVNELKEEKASLEQSIEENKRKMEELRQDRESLEKFAREEYFMKKSNEVIFIIK